MEKSFASLLTTVLSLLLFSSACAPNKPAALEGPSSGPPNGHIDDARTLFLKNCAHCHGADAHGDEGPDLHNIDWSHAQIVGRIRNGKRGQMTAFAGKLRPDQIDILAAYVLSLK